MRDFLRTKGPTNNNNNKKKQASEAGVSRQCLEDKMSKDARNIDIGHFDITQPHERVKIWVTWVEVTNENIKQYIFHTEIKSKQSFQSWLSQTV